jgi:hypothetical protein
MEVDRTLVTYSVGGAVSLRLEGGDFTKESYGGVQSDGLGGRVVGLAGTATTRRLPSVVSTKGDSPVD